MLNGQKRREQFRKAQTAYRRRREDELSRLKLAIRHIQDDTSKMGQSLLTLLDYIAERKETAGDTALIPFITQAIHQVLPAMKSIQGVQLESDEGSPEPAPLPVEDIEHRDEREVVDSFMDIIRPCELSANFLTDMSWDRLSLFQSLHIMDPFAISDHRGAPLGQRLQHSALARAAWLLQDTEVARTTAPEIFAYSGKVTISFARAKIGRELSKSCQQMAIYHRQQSESWRLEPAQNTTPLESEAPKEQASSPSHADSADSWGAKHPGWLSPFHVERYLKNQGFAVRGDELHFPKAEAVGEEPVTSSETVHVSRLVSGKFANVV